MPPPPPPPPPGDGDAAPGASRLSHTVAGLGCPSCGGPLEVDSGLRVVVCPFCGTPLLALSEVGLRRFAIEPQLGAEEARQRARGWLGRGIAKDPRLAREAQVGEAFLTFLPFYRVEADCVGIALGTEQRTRWVGSGKRRRRETYEVDVERQVEKSFDRTYPAVEVAEWGIQRVDLAGDPLVPYDAAALERRGMLFPPTGSEVKVRDRALARFREESQPERGLKRVRFRFLETVRERVSVVYYPLWVVRYRFRDRGYQILIDAEDGSLAYGKAPGNDLYRAAVLVATEAVAAYLLTTAVQVGGFGALALGGGLGLALLAWGWRKFRYGGVVVEGSGSRKGEPGLAAAMQRAGWNTLRRLGQ